ncbi:glycoside hydrolase family 3 protein [Elizabethkingia argentiflava]|uniref:beta-N-acetylhexosaminidase n=1 Tax=Elizabethkingia argenteiflava TaxID=2681556 RepID=A0A845PRR2_9FLAO|nr:glycoside hydrolase family 3 N-terminal domain-containing protein [Elizabethkingia argenteiflava]NAW50959.1 glycoside hydrolase family 3 protein [Elizabethkingia argenteiflava]
MNKCFLYSFFLLFVLASPLYFSQYHPKNINKSTLEEAYRWVDKTYSSLSQDEKLGQLFIIDLYADKDQTHINSVRQLVLQEKIGGIILMQGNALNQIESINEFQNSSKIPLLIGIDAEWGLYQRIATAHKFPWAITLGAIQNEKLIYEMASQIAVDAKRMGINWNFAPVVDVNTNPMNPIIGNRSFGSDVQNTIRKGLAYSNGLQDHGVLSSIKHFPGHGDTDKDSHLDLPVVKHNIERLMNTELAPFTALINKNVGGVMVAHLYVPALEARSGVPASLSYPIVTDLLKKKLGYKGIIITDALNMGAITRRYSPGEADKKAFAAGNDIMLFSKGVSEGKKLIQQAIDQGEIPQSRVEESVKKILLTKYLLGLQHFKRVNPLNIDRDLNDEKHAQLSEKLYAHALTLLKNDQQLLPLQKGESVYYVPLEEAPYQTFEDELSQHTNLIIKKANEIGDIPPNAKVIIGFHKDNSTAYKPYKISEASKSILTELSHNHRVILNVFGSPYALMDIDIQNIPTVLVSYENNEYSQKATVKGLLGQSSILGRLPVSLNSQLKYGAGQDLKQK